jgi:hypothetical protein
MQKFLLLAFLCFPFLASAQENLSYLIPAKVKHGSIMLGGTLNASAYKTNNQLDLPLGPEEGTNLLLNLHSKNGYFLDHDFALGLVLSIEHESLSTTTEQREETFRRTRMLLGPFTRYYLDNGIFGEASVQVGLLNFSSGQKSNLLESGLGIGYSHFINEKVALEPMLSFRFSKEWKSGQANTSFGPMFGFGVQAYILRRRAHIIKEAL